MSFSGRGIFVSVFAVRIRVTGTPIQTWESFPQTSRRADPSRGLRGNFEPCSGRETGHGDDDGKGDGNGGGRAACVVLLRSQKNLAPSL